MKSINLLRAPFLSIATLVMLVTLLIASAPMAQSRVQQSIITQLLWQSLRQCYEAQTEHLDADDEVIIAVELNAFGDIADLPHLVSPTRLSDGERALLRQATVALIDCTPITSARGGQDYIWQLRYPR